MNSIAPYMKAVVAIGGAVLTAILTQFPDNETVQQWGPIVAALLTAVSVYAVPNRDPQALHQDESVQPPEAGESAVLLAVVVACAVLLVLFLFGAIR